MSSWQMTHNLSGQHCWRADGVFLTLQQKATPAPKLSMFCCKLKLIPLTNTLGKFWLWKTCILCWCVERAGVEILRLIQSYFRSTLWSNSIPTKSGIILSLKVWDKNGRYGRSELRARDCHQKQQTFLFYIFARLHVCLFACLDKIPQFTGVLGLIP